MRNLILENVSAAEIEAVLNEVGPRPLMPPREDPCWRDVAGFFPVDRWIGEITARAEAERREGLPELTAGLYADFSATGRRRAFEEVYFSRRRRLGDVAVAALFAGEEDEAGWMADLVERAENILAEESWALPAHVEDPSGKDPYAIDLFAAETANLMAELVTVFGERFPDGLVRRIRSRLQKTVFHNYLERWDRFAWTRQTHNWNAVCHQGVLGAALAIEEDDALVAEIVRLGSRCLRRFLKGFTDDGGCSEGPAYWNYGFGWFTVLNEQLETRTGGRLSLFEGVPEIREIARFPCRVSLAGGKVVNFSDSVPEARFHPAFLQYLGERLNDDLLREESHFRYAEAASRPLRGEGRREDLFHHLRLFLYCPDDVPESPVPPIREDAWFPRLGVMVVHGSNGGKPVEFAAKAGHNREHHNHNDCGSFLYHVDGRRFAVELGSPEYTRDYLSGGRYGFLAARSLGHSVPLINNREQEAGKAFRAEVLEAEPEADPVVLRLDLTKAYPASAGCLRCLRSFSFDRRTCDLRVEDRFSLNVAKALETALITDAEVSREGDSILLTRDGIQVLVALGTGGVLADIERHKWKNHAGQWAVVSRLVIRPAKLATESVLGYTLRPAPSTGSLRSPEP